MTALARISHHRRVTACHTWHVDWAGRKLFVKANPDPDDAQREIAGHARVRSRYPVPALIWTRRIGHWTVLTYARWPHIGHDTGLLVDEITRAERTGDTARLDACLDDIFGHYGTVIADTLRLTTFADTASAIYRDPEAGDVWLNRGHAAVTPWLALPDGRQLRPSKGATTRLVVNGREHRMDLAHLLVELRVHFAGRNPTWVALTQGDPTDLNLGWSIQDGPVWFDHDTGGFNAIAGEFASFLLYQRLHGSWLAPTYQPVAFRDRPSALLTAALNQPAVRVERDGPHELRIDYTHRPSAARLHVMRRYLRGLVEPVAARLDVGDLMGWLRPYLVHELLAVQYTGQLSPRDSALVLGLLADTLHPDTTVHELLALTGSRPASTR